MTDQLESETGPVLSALLNELADVFLKAEGYDDALESAVYANQEAENLRGETVTYAERVLEQESEINRLQERDDFNVEAKQELVSEVARLQEQYAELSDDMFTANAKWVSDVNRLAAEVADRNRQIQTDQALIRNLQAQLNTARSAFGDAFVYGQVPGTGPTRKNRPKLTKAEVGGIRSMVGNGSTITAVARTYGVHPSTVSRIASGVYHRGEDTE